MKVQDINAGFHVSDIEELEPILRRRNKKGVNAFWLSHDSEPYPMLSVLVKDDLATLHYIPKDKEAGCRSIGNVPNMAKGETMRFSISNHSGDDVYVLNDAVLPFSVALIAAEEFFNSNQLPHSVEWFDL